MKPICPHLVPIDWWTCSGAAPPRRAPRGAPLPSAAAATPPPPRCCSSELGKAAAKTGKTDANTGDTLEAATKSGETAITFYSSLHMAKRKIWTFDNPWSLAIGYQNMTNDNIPTSTEVSSDVPIELRLEPLQLLGSSMLIRVDYMNHPS